MCVTLLYLPCCPYVTVMIDWALRSVSSSFAMALTFAASFSFCLFLFLLYLVLPPPPPHPTHTPFAASFPFCLYLFLLCLSLHLLLVCTPFLILCVLLAWQLVLDSTLCCVSLCALVVTNLNQAVVFCLHENLCSIPHCIMHHYAH